MFWTIFEQLCQTKNTTPTSVAKFLGFSNATATKWKKGSLPNGSTLEKLADYFGVSVDYLLGKTEQKEKPSPEGESFEEDVVIVHRDGKTTVRKFTKAQLDAIEALFDQLGGSEPK